MARNINTETGEVTEDPRGNGAPMPGTDIEQFGAAELARLLAPMTIPVRAWAEALVNVTDFDEESENDPSYAIVASILLAETSADVFAAMHIEHSKEYLGESPGAKSPRLRVYGAMPLKSAYEDGPSCFAVLDVEEIAEKRRFKMTCGARAVQAAVLAHIARGWIPFDCVLTRRAKQTRKGYYPLNLEAGG